MSKTEMSTEIRDFGVEEQEHSLVDDSADPTDQQLKDVETAQPQAPQFPKVKKPVAKVMTAAAFVEKAKETDEALFDAMNAQKFNPLAGAQVLPKAKVPVRTDVRAIDWSKVKEEDIYNDSIPIEARPFSSEDSLGIDLVDKNYAARWVNKNPIILGKALAAGFTYITAEDLASPLDVAIVEDVNGRFLNLDVLAMKCPKSIYFAAKKAAFLRAVNTVNSLSSKKAARNQAMSELMKSGAGVAEEFESGKVAFYDASGIDI